MRWIHAGWRPFVVTLGLVLLVTSIGAAAPVKRPASGTVLHHLAKRWAPEKLGRDDCGVIPTNRVGRLIDAKVRLTERMLRPAGDGWQVRCGYGDGRLGLATATVTRTTGVAPDSWQPYRRASESAPIRLQPSATVGDETFVAFGHGPGRSTAVRIEARDGSSTVRLEYFAPVTEPGRMPNPVPGLRLASSLLARVTDSAYAPGTLQVKAFSGCERIDRAAAAEVLGEPLRTARTTNERRYGPDGDLHCGYAGERADLRVTLWHRMDAGAYLEPLRPALRGLGDAAAFHATVFPDGQARFQAAIQVGDSIVSVDAGYADRENLDRSKPTKAERELLDSIVRSLT